MLALSIIAVAQPVVAQSINDQPPARTVAPPAPKVDINRASIAQLMRVPGITQSYAQRIIAGRPYANKGQLDTQAILPPQVYEAAKDRLIAHRIK
jgi:competence protein ComEA